LLFAVLMMLVSCRSLQLEYIILNWGPWQDWLHDSAVITAPDRHYILVGLTHHPSDDDYLVELARGIDALMR
jgi:hypothetical protein